MEITEEQIELLKKLLPDKAEELLEQGDAMAILDELDILNLCLLDENDDPTDASTECERLRDTIHWNNFHVER